MLRQQMLARHQNGDFVNMKRLRKYSVLIATLILCWLMYSLLSNLSGRFKAVEEAYDKGEAINLSASMNVKVLDSILIKNGYVKDAGDAEYISGILKERLKTKEFPYLYVLQKRDYGKVAALDAERDKRLVQRLDKSRDALGQNDLLIPPLSELKSSCPVASGSGKILVKIEPEKNGVKSCDSVVVRLRLHYIGEEEGKPTDSVVGYAKTDKEGCAEFTGLELVKDQAYSVLPIKRYFEYGPEQGVRCEDLKKKAKECKFIQMEHRISMFDNLTLKQIKSDGTITVRTPQEFKVTVIKWFGIVILSWWILSVVLMRRKRNFDPLIVASALFLTGLCVLMMFAIQNPLADEMRGVEMAQGVVIGVALIILLQYVDFIKLYQHKYKIGFDIPLSLFNWFFLPFKKKVAWLAPVLTGYYVWYKKFGALLLVGICFILFKWLDWLQITRLSPRIERGLSKLPNGVGWFLVAIILTAMMFIPAFAGVVGGMVVNLKLGPLTFQPSEIAKYLMLFFMAAFFAQQADSIIQYSQPGTKKIIKKVKLLGWTLVFVAMLMMLYAVLGDMGPALVICITFILLYSLIKSKVNLDNLTEDDKWKRIFTCDFAILIYGVVSFAAFLLIGYFYGGSVGNAILFGVLWFVLWIVVGLFKKRQFYETAFIMNLLIFMFIFGGKMMMQMDAFKDSPMAERFDQRARMCVNTWGELDEEHNGEYAEPVSNIQVANGLWAIATGGVDGQGLGKGNANLIPAFHTDMILSSMAEQIGWIGLVAVVLVMAVLLRRMVVLGYKVGHPFAFYFCMGVAIVTGVQFFIIALGSSGMIPLTGITVPFLSYGRVSMILNLAALGVVLSLSKNAVEKKEESIEQEVRQRSVGDYNFPVAIVSWTFVLLALFTLGVWQYYAFWHRDETLIRPAYVHNRQGIPLVEYNPRIALLTDAMYAGDIYDRNGVLLATSDKSKINIDALKLCGLNKNDLDSIVKSHKNRYYPFGAHMFFMVGDKNNKLFWNFDSQIGYMAEARHNSQLRGFDVYKRDKNGVPILVYLKGDVKTDDRFLDVMNESQRKANIYDYTCMIPYLKDGIYGDLVKKHNDDVKQGVLSMNLTVDAKLQTMLQEQLKQYVAGNDVYKKNKYLRISVVVLDAVDGDLLASANYPLPDYTRLKKEDDAGHRSYKDSGHAGDKKWTAYTDMDLGLTYKTAPGSTAKTMSALAGLNKMGIAKAREKMTIYRYEVIDYKDKVGGWSWEPPKGYKESDKVNMRKAIVESSNCYFVKLVHENQLYPQLKDVYTKVGVRPNGQEAYLFDYNKQVSLDHVVDEQSKVAIAEYEKYKLKTFDNSKDRQTLRKGEWQWAWGQGTLDASPLSMARVVSSVVNEGQMPVTRYLLTDSIKYVAITSKDKAKELKSYLFRQAHEENSRFIHDSIGGKTGTPMRALDSDKNKIKDGWYVFYVESNGDADKHPLAVAVRIERISITDKEAGSGRAQNLAKDVVLPVLTVCDYYKK